MEKFQVGQKVERIGSAKDYTTGRKGEIVELPKEGARIRVRWTQESNGDPITTMGAKPENGVRTWVNGKFLRIITSLIILLACFACTERTEFHVEESLRPFYDDFMQEAAKRGSKLDDVNNLIMIVRPNALKDYGGLAVTRKVPGGQHYIYLDYDFFINHSADRLQIILFHELGHCYLNRSHNTVYSIMNPIYSAKGWPTCYAGEDDCKKQKDFLISELFYNTENN